MLSETPAGRNAEGLGASDAAGDGRGASLELVLGAALLPPVVAGGCPVPLVEPQAATRTQAARSASHRFARACQFATVRMLPAFLIGAFVKPVVHGVGRLP